MTVATRLEKGPPTRPFSLAAPSARRRLVSAVRFPEGRTLVDLEWAKDFAEEWVAAWNAQDLERVLSHYHDDFEMSSPLIIERMGEPSGRLCGKAAIRSYWAAGLAAMPSLRFELLAVFAGADGLSLHYRSVGRRCVIEVLTVNGSGEIIRGAAYYGDPC